MIWGQEGFSELMLNKNVLFVTVMGLAAGHDFAVMAAPSKALVKRKTAVARTVKTPAKLEVLQQVKSGPLKIRLRRARWAESEEVLMWRQRGKQLTLWFDAVLDPPMALPQDSTAADFIVNVSLLDKRGQSVQVFPVDPVRSLHRPSLPYVPAKNGFKADAQSVWRAQPFDPDFDAVKLQIEWLRPGHPFTRKTVPPSILEIKDEAITPEAREWLQRFEMELPQQQIEYGAVSKTAPIAEGETQRFKAILHSWRKGTARVVSGQSAGTSHVYFEAALLLRSTDPRNGALLKSVEVVLRNEAGQTIAMAQRIGEASQWFAPNGKPLKANERFLSGSFNLAQPLDENAKWSLELQSRDSKAPLLTLSDLPMPSGSIGAAK